MSTEILAAAHHHHDSDATDVFGFWLYILTDCLLFASLFATFVVLNYPGAYGPRLKDFVSLPYVLGETFFLLASNFTFGLAMLLMYKHKDKFMQLMLAVTFIFGACFVGMELNEFVHLAHEGYSWQTSGAASAFFTLVGTHGLHVSIGLLWILLMMAQIATLKITSNTRRRMMYLGIFWNFLDIVWIFVFTIVYLMGAI